MRVDAVAAGLEPQRWRVLLVFIIATSVHVLIDAGAFLLAMCRRVILNASPIGRKAIDAQRRASGIPTPRSTCLTALEPNR